MISSKFPALFPKRMLGIKFDSPRSTSNASRRVLLKFQNMEQ